MRAAARAKPIASSPAPQPTNEPIPTGETSAEILAREQLADLRERRAAEEKERIRQAAVAEQEKLDREQSAYTQRAVATVDKLRQEYVLSHDGLSAGILAGTEPLPEEWVNARLKAMKIPWSYKIDVGGGTILSPTAGNPYYRP
jgi:hypothetical protein